ncbi:hypothetical protein JK359_00450 [Streptomyces actinomycinicus]|uniref:Secreted protein n=1 Tax=Streptomyces actinomycinicus TaxID=1695166 RepID=A0A937EDP4_9ACTN|nr:hypothetical protein [Streptomyces actinomycinicus]MBL1080460.1 hypothetical protein [Streptomyces actinomycinicus]
MGSLRLTLCTGILATAVFAPAAHAAGTGSVSVTPASPGPGSDVTVRVSGCGGDQGAAASRAFVADARLTGTQGALAGETRIRSSVAPGVYDVQVSCGGAEITGRITVGAAGAAQPGEPAVPSAAASPVAPVDAGGGGTAHFATVATSGSGPGTGQSVTGLALAGVAAVAVGLRARRSRRTR